MEPADLQRYYAYYAMYQNNADYISSDETLLSSENLCRLENKQPAFLPDEGELFFAGHINEFSNSPMLSLDSCCFR
jgi:hypothetical protein